MKKSRSSTTAKSLSKLTSSPSSAQQAKRRKLALEKKAEWNTYLTDANRFRVTDEEIMKKKSLLVSKHNILSDQYQPSKIKSKGKILKASKLLQEDENDDDDNYSEVSTEAKSKTRKGRKSSEDNGTSSLDLLELESQSEEEEDRRLTTPARSSTKKRNHQTIVDTSKSSNSHNGSSSNIFENMIASSFHSSKSERPVKSKPVVKYHSMKHSTSSKEKKHQQSLFKENDKIPEDELTNMTQEIRMLIEELQYYEELSGKKSILQSTVRGISLLSSLRLFMLFSFFLSFFV
jgi:hypothetical protein